MSELILEGKDIRYTYPCGKDALMGLDIRVTGGKRLAVLGANGSGKTTLFLCLNGTLTAKNGSIFLDGRKMGYSHRELNEWRSKVGLVFQNPDDQVVAGTVIQDIAFGPLNLGMPPEEARAKAVGILRELNIAHYVERPTHELSHGERKLVAIAGVLVMNPSVIILDEPLAGLDPAGADQVRKALDDVHARGTTLVISTHDMDFAYEWADEVVVLSKGRTLRQGPVEELFSDAELLKQTNLQEPWIHGLTKSLLDSRLIGTESKPLRSRKAVMDLLAGMKHSR